MGCLAGSAECLYAIGKTEEALASFQELLELNPNDNQGIRDTRMLYLIEAGNYQKYREYDAFYNDDLQAAPAFNRALAAFVEQGETDEARRLLGTAMSLNKHVAKLLAARKEVFHQPAGDQPDSREEAEIYVYYAQSVWREMPGAIDFLRKAGKQKGGGKA